MPVLNAQEFNELKELSDNSKNLYDLLKKSIPKFKLKSQANITAIHDLSKVIEKSSTDICSSLNKLTNAITNKND